MWVLFHISLKKLIFLGKLWWPTPQRPFINCFWRISWKYLTADPQVCNPRKEEKRRATRTQVSTGSTKPKNPKLNNYFSKNRKLFWNWRFYALQWKRFAGFITKNWSYWLPSRKRTQRHQILVLQRWTRARSVHVYDRNCRNSCALHRGLLLRFFFIFF